MPTKQAQVPEPVAGQSSTPLTDGGVLRIGGLGADGPTTSLTVINSRTGRVKELPNMRMARAFHTATMLPDGRVFVLGGVGLNQKALKSAVLLDPATGEIEELKEFLKPLAPHDCRLVIDHLWFCEPNGGAGLELGGAS